MRWCPNCFCKLLAGLAALWGMGLAVEQPDVQFPPKPEPREFVVDEASLIDFEARSEIERISSETLTATAVPILVVTIPSLSQYGASGLSIEDYAQSLFNLWGIGHPEITVGDQTVSRNLGVLLLVALSERKARIELGADWDHRKDAECSEIMQDHIIAAFKRGDYAGGVLAGVKALSAMVRDEPLPSPPRPGWHYVLFIGALGLGIFSLVSFIRSGSRGWAWVFWGVVFSILGFILFHVLASRGRGGGRGYSGGSFGGGFSGGGGATGSW